MSEHPVGAIRWVYMWTSDDWERCVVIGNDGSRFTVQRPNGKLSTGHYGANLHDQHPRPRENDNRRRKARG